MEEVSGVVVCTHSSSYLSFWSRVLWAKKFTASLCKTASVSKDRDTASQPDRQMKGQKGKWTREEAEGGTGSRQPLKFVGISSNPV